MDPSEEAANPAQGSALEATAKLLDRVQAGDDRARERLLARFLPLLRHWAHGRLPAAARSAFDTDDIVQVTLVRALGHVGEFRSRHEGAFLAYLRRILLNVIRDEIRKAAARPGRKSLPDGLRDRAPSSLEQLLLSEAMESYEAALASLPEIQQEAVILRLEFGFGFERIAEAIQSPSTSAARMMVSRALVKLSEAMDAHE